MKKEKIYLTIVQLEKWKKYHKINYSLYTCECSAKNKNKWFFIGWAVPHTIGYFSQIKDNLYLMCENGDRYRLSDIIIKLLDIKKGDTEK